MAEKLDAAHATDLQLAPDAHSYRTRRRRFLAKLAFAMGACAMAPMVMRQGSANAAEVTGRRTVLITGSTSGMGRRLAERLAAPGTTILVHGRNRQRGEEVMKAIQDAGGEARFYAADFSSLADVRSLADAVTKSNDRLDVLVNNAGIYFGEPESRQLSSDGHELRFAINYLAPFALTHRLAPLLKDSRPARIVNVASSGQNAIDFDNLMLERSYGHQRAYGQSKLALIMFTIDIAEELKEAGVIANAVHPANYMDTPMTRDAGIQPWNSVDEGADAVLHLINAPELAGTTGAYFSGERQSRASSQAYDAAARARLRDLSRRLADI
ncbi:SDR family NAD(P)-dependent oxidoreductase [Brenneria tiliae]|uniref:SDR family NAD(P)-dependent oxidoreductase n=1 Tax=Brenneria tiliae TaxID=2914984 RepID=UPI0020148EB5|nr:SDR family NAD(P)-dependent oxidoreductase [Brenneria tiliae]MCL2900328.1 SDR family NAD(P)-dependent oxidoreductase [Brenneria tiliae]MCL2904185.1 SDR family NAD(P)-dependent oxidoreductase [Brenneria tiliae]